MSTRILLADDHTLLRGLLCSELESHSDMEVVGEAEDGRKTLQLVRELVPDIVLMDIAMPNLNGMDATRQIVRELPAVKVIALSMHHNRKFVINMLNAGASGYLLKDCTSQELVEAIRTVAGGGAYLAPKKVVKEVTDWIQDPQKPESLLDTLKDREREVFQLLVEGNNTKEIAIVLHLTDKAIQAIRHKIMVKLNAHSIVDLVLIALREGIISIE